MSAFNIMNCDDGHEFFYASYLIVMNLRGNVTSVKVIDASDKDSYGRMHFDALKLKDPKHFVLGGNTDPYEESGPAYLYNWETQYMLQLADDKAAASAISSAGFKQSTWWEDNADGLDVSRDWRL